MRLGVAMAVLATSSSCMDGVNAFGLSSFGSKRRSASRVGMVKAGWENDDFLAGLGGEDGKSQDANEAYWKQSQYETAMANRGVPPPPPVQGDPGFDDVPVVVVTPEQAKRNAEMDEKARLYRQEQQQARMQMMQRQAQEQTPPPQQQQQQQRPEYDYNEPPPPAPTPQGAAAPVNRDAWQVANIGDLYLAQLKKDSNIRIKARESGDVVTANAVMQDEEIDKMKDLIKVNPYLEAERKAASALAPDEGFLVGGPGMVKQAPAKPKNFAGISYKDRLQQKSKKTNPSASVATAVPVTPPEPVAAAPVAPPEPVVVAVAAPVPTPEPVVVAAVPVAPPEPVVFAAPVSTPEPVVVAEVSTPPPVQAVAPVTEASVAPPAAAAPTAAAGEESDENRRILRTMMGLMLKHRGGPNFGAGRLKGPEANRFETTAQEVVGMLRAEIPAATPSISAPAAVAATPPSQPVMSSSPVTDVSTAMAGAIGCIEAVAMMYKGADSPAAKEGLLRPLRAALMSAVETCDKVIATLEGSPTVTATPPAVPAAVPVQVEAPPVAPSTMAFPTSYAVTEPDAIDEPTVPTNIGNDANTVALRETYEALQAARGDEKYGLKSMSAQEAQSLSESISEVRGILMEELDTGIPDAPAPEKVTAATTSDSNTSKYQQMLTKAKAEKAAKRA